jgi:hypothetical protein
MTMQARGRLLRVNETVIDQADYFQVDDFTRVSGLTFVDVSTRLFFDNALQPWTLVNGASITNGLVTAGSVYFHEITGATGHYSLRFRPNAAGYWRLLLTYAAGQQILAYDYDVVSDPAPMHGGLKASFV